MAAQLGDIGRDVQERLLHPCMQAKWRGLGNAKVTEEMLDQLDDWQRLPAPDRRRFSVKDQVRAAFFATAVVELTLPPLHRPVVLRNDIDKAAAGWRNAKDRCRVVLDDPATQTNPKLAEAAAIMAEYFDKEAKLMEDQRSSALVVKNSTMGAELRVRVRSLASRVKKITGDYRYDTIATVVNVGLQLDNQASISEGTVRKWCASV